MIFIYLIIYIIIIKYINKIKMKMLNIIINLKSNSATTIWPDQSILWTSLDKYEFKENEDYSVVEQDGAYGYSKPRVVKGSFLIALLKNLKKYIDN